MNKKQYKLALQAVSPLMDINPHKESRLGAALILISESIEDYEKLHFKFERPCALEMVKFLIEERGLSQKEFADKCGLEQASVSRLLAGKQRPDVNTIAKMHREFGLPLDTLVMRWWHPIKGADDE